MLGCRIYQSRLAYSDLLAPFDFKSPLQNYPTPGFSLPNPLGHVGGIVKQAIIAIEQRKLRRRL